MKSIAIIGKGPSIKRCKREFIEEYDEVATCGRPIFSKYEHLIGNRAHLDFCNCHDPRIYQKDRIKDLGIRRVINTNNPIPKNIYFCPNGEEYDPNGRNKVINFFKNNYDLDPATGTIAIQYILDMKKYDKIGIFGFDLMEVNENVYYFDQQEVQTSLHYLYKNGVYKNGKRIKKTGHNLKKTFKYISDIIEKNKNIEFTILSNRKFKSSPNLVQLT